MPTNPDYWPMCTISLDSIPRCPEGRGPWLSDEQVAQVQGVIAARCAPIDGVTVAAEDRPYVRMIALAGLDKADADGLWLDVSDIFHRRSGPMLRLRVMASPFGHSMDQAEVGAALELIAADIVSALGLDISAVAYIDYSPQSA